MQQEDRTIIEVQTACIWGAIFLHTYSTQKQRNANTEKKTINLWRQNVNFILTATVCPFHLVASSDGYVSSVRVARDCYVPSMQGIL